jgi:CO/xanthine dehydrogenase FAD-binding subunit
LKEGKNILDMEYVSPKTVSGAFALIRRWKGKVRLIAGGTNVIPEIRAKSINPLLLIDISHLKNLSYIKEEKRGIRIGGLTSISEIACSKMIEKYAPVLFNAANQLGNPLVRNRATIAGNLADASPAADTAVPLLTLGAEVVTVRSTGKGRQIPIEQFFIGPNKSVLKNDEIIREISFPKPLPDAKMAYVKLGLRNAMAISVVSLAVLLVLERQRCVKARIALGAVAPTPIRAYKTEEILKGEVTKELIEDCCESVKGEVSPITDIRASAEYRRDMVSIFLGRLIREVTL